MMQRGLSDLDMTVAAGEPLDHGKVEWQRVRRARYLIHQDLRYEYPAPIYDLDQCLLVLPPQQHRDQCLVDYELEVASPDFKMYQRDDEFGNMEVRLTVPHVEQTIRFEARILVERSAEKQPHYLPVNWLCDSRLLEPSMLTHPDDVLRQVAATLLESGKEGLALADQINTWAYQALRYVHGVTNIHTTAAEALALGQGVCQDYAHVMLALCRLCGLPARYVSGHMLGEGGTHAWVEVIFPVAGRRDLAIALPFDPTHGCLADLSYLTIAVGRDYYDVAPTSGTFRAAHRGQLTARKHVGLVLLEHA